MAGALPQELAEHIWAMRGPIAPRVDPLLRHPKCALHGAVHDRASARIARTASATIARSLSDRPYRSARAWAASSVSGPPNLIAQA